MTTLRFEFDVEDDFGHYAEHAELDHRPTVDDLHAIAQQHAREMFESNDGLQVIYDIWVTSEDCEEFSPYRLAYATREVYGPKEASQ